MASCDHKYTHTTVKIAVRDDGNGKHQVLDIVIYCLVCGRTTGSNMASKSSDWQSMVRQALPELDEMMTDFIPPAETALAA